MQRTKDEALQNIQSQLRNFKNDQSVTIPIINQLYYMQLTDQKMLQNPNFRYAPIVVSSNVERLTLDLVKIIPHAKKK